VISEIGLAEELILMKVTEKQKYRKEPVMFFNDEPKNFEQLDPEELNSMIDAWGKDLFKQECDRQRDSAFLSESGHSTPTPVAARLSFAFIRNWKRIGRQQEVASAA
jgi:hypothetical protein